jgi:hypothetical protein
VNDEYWPPVCHFSIIMVLILILKYFWNSLQFQKYFEISPHIILKTAIAYTKYIFFPCSDKQMKLIQSLELSHFNITIRRTHLSSSLHLPLHLSHLESFFWVSFVLFLTFEHVTFLFTYWVLLPKSYIIAPRGFFVLCSDILWPLFYVFAQIIMFLTTAHFCDVFFLRVMLAFPVSVYVKLP